MFVDDAIPNWRDLRHSQSAVPMIKSLAAVAIFAILGASVIALPWFAVKAEASEDVALAKADRLPIQAPAQDCFKQVWPDFATSCLRNGGSQARIVEARLVTPRR
jgi:hypothetical protein